MRTCQSRKARQRKMCVTIQPNHYSCGVLQQSKKKTSPWLTNTLFLSPAPKSPQQEFGVKGQSCKQHSIMQYASHPKKSQKIVRQLIREVSNRLQGSRERAFPGVFSSLWGTMCPCPSISLLGRWLLSCRSCIL